MAERISETLQKKLSERLGFYEDLGIQLFYRARGSAAVPDSRLRLDLPATAHISTPDQKEQTLPKPAGKPALPRNPAAPPPVSSKMAPPSVAAGPSLLKRVDSIARATPL